MKPKDFIKKNIFPDFLAVFLFITPLIFGLYYEFAAYLGGVALCIYFVFLIHKRKTISYSFDLKFILIAFVIISYLLVIPFSVDKGMAFWGFLKFFVILIFAFILLQTASNEHKMAYFYTVPLSGALMTILSLCSLISPNLSSNFFSIGRLGGFFQYANTFALFLLIGIIVLCFRVKKYIFDYAAMAILVFGIFKTGSRGVFVMLIIALIVILIIQNKSRKFILINLGVAVLAGLAVIFITGNVNTIARFLQITTSSSTFNGRLLYDVDGIHIVASHPFGLGYLGYSDIQHAVQTGIYTVRFVHNDFLQFALDVGILPSIAFVLSILLSIFSKTTSTLQKLILIIVSAHSLMDFDLQYLSVFFVVIMCLDFGSLRILKLKKVVKKYTFWSIACCVTLAYFCVVTFTNYINDYTLTSQMYSYNTEALTEKLLRASTPQIASQLADSILKQNKYSFVAYDAKAMVCAVNGDFDKMVYYKQKSISVYKYKIDMYDNYIALLKRPIDYYMNGGDKEKAKKYIFLALDVPRQLELVRKSSNPLAFKITEKPTLYLSNTVLQYLKYLQSIDINK